MKINEVKVLTDENISPKVMQFLRNSGLDVLDVKEEGWFGEVDEVLLGIAHQQERFVLTHDSDFGTLVVNQGKPCYGILYLRLKNLKAPHVIQVCEGLLRQNLDISSGTILVIEETRIRVRKISHSSS